MNTQCEVVLDRGDPSTWKPYADSLSEDERLAVVDEIDQERARRDPVAFAEYVMEDDDTGEPWVLADFHKEWHGLMSEERRVQMEGPRDHGKSGSIVSRTLWELGRNLNILIKIICCSDAMSQKRLSPVSQYIEKSERLHKVFPHLKPSEPDSWTKQKLFVERSMKSGEPSVEAFGILSSSSGSRADLLFFDDVVDARNAIINPALQATVKKVFFENCMNFLPANGGRAVYIDTPWTTTDLSNMLKGLGEWKLWRRPATIHRPLWPERWGPDQLQARKDELPLRSWQRQFELIVIAEEGATFDHQKIEEISRDVAFVAPEEEETVYYAGVDIAISGSGCWFVMEIGAKTPDGKKNVVETIRRRGITRREQARLIETAHERYGFELILVESNAYQKALVDDTQDMGLPVKGYVTTGYSKRDQGIGIPGFASEIERDEWIIWDSQGKNRPLIEELKGYPFADVDDCVLAAFFLREAMRKSESRGPAIPSVSSPYFSRTIQPRFTTSPYVRPKL